MLTMPASGFCGVCVATILQLDEDMCRLYSGELFMLTIWLCVQFVDKSSYALIGGSVAATLALTVMSF